MSDKDIAAVIGAAAQVGESRLAAISVDPRDEVRGMLNRITQQNYPTIERARMAASIVISSMSQIEELIFNRDHLALRRKLADIERSVRPLTYPERPLIFQDQVRSLISYFLNRSWLTEEVEMSGEFYRPGERISDIRAASVKFGERTISRAEVRRRLALDKANARLVETAAKREEVAIQRERENEECLARGEEPRYGSL